MREQGIQHVSPQLLEDVDLVRAFGFASLTLLLWEHLITLPDEIQLIWPSRWTSVKALFLISRYGNLVVQAVIVAEQTGAVFHPTPSFCFAFVLFRALYQWLAFSVIHVLILIRAWAIRQRSRNATVTLITIFVLYTFCSVAFEIVNMLSSSYQAEITDRMCTRILPSPSWVIWIVGFILEVAVLVLNLTSLHGQFPSQYKPLSPFVQALYRDSILFFVGVLAGTFFNLSSWVIYNARPRNYMSDLISTAVVSIAGQRLSLNMRKMNLRMTELTASQMSKIIDQQINAIPGLRGDGLVMEDESTLDVENTPRLPSETEICEPSGSSIPDV